MILGTVEPRLLYPYIYEWTTQYSFKDSGTLTHTYCIYEWPHSLVLKTVEHRPLHVWTNEWTLQYVFPDSWTMTPTYCIYKWPHSIVLKTVEHRPLHTCTNGWNSMSSEPHSMVFFVVPMRVGPPCPVLIILIPPYSSGIYKNILTIKTVVFTYKEITYCKHLFWQLISKNYTKSASQTWKNLFKKNALCVNNIWKLKT